MIKSIGDIRKDITSEFLEAENTLRKIESGFRRLDAPLMREEEEEYGQVSIYQDGWGDPRKKPEYGFFDGNPYYTCALFRAGRIPISRILFYGNHRDLQEKTISLAFNTGLLDDAYWAAYEYISGNPEWEFALNLRVVVEEGLLSFIPARSHYQMGWGEVDYELAEFEI